MSLLGPEEKQELEDLILAKLTAYWNSHGSAGLLAPGVSLVVDASGAAVAPQPASGAHVLASVEVCKLFTALCHITADGPGMMPRDALASLAKEAMTAVAAQVNRIAPD
jgi:hypothetical protein